MGRSSPDNLRRNPFQYSIKKMTNLNLYYTIKSRKKIVEFIICHSFSSALLCPPLPTSSVLLCPPIPSYTLLYPPIPSYTLLYPPLPCPPLSFFPPSNVFCSPFLPPLLSYHVSEARRFQIFHPRREKGRMKRKAKN